MPNMTVPAQAPGAKSLPAELKVGGGNPFARLRAEHPGYGVRTRTGWENGVHPGRHLGFSGLNGLNGFQIQAGPVNPLVLNPIAAMARARHGWRGLGDTTVDTPGTVDFSGAPPDPTLTIPDFTSAPLGTDLMAGLDSITPVIPGWSGPGLLTATVTPPAPPNGYQWAQVLDSSGKTIAQILAISQGGSVTQLPNGLRIVQGSQAGAVQGAAGGFLTGGSGGVTGMLGGNGGLLMIAAVVLVVMMSGRGR